MTSSELQAEEHRYMSLEHTMYLGQNDRTAQGSTSSELYLF